MSLLFNGSLNTAFFTHTVVRRLTARFFPNCSKWEENINFGTKMHFWVENSNSLGPCENHFFSSFICFFFKGISICCSHFRIWDANIWYIFFTSKHRERKRKSLWGGFDIDIFVCLSASLTSSSLDASFCLISFFPPTETNCHTQPLILSSPSSGIWWSYMEIFIKLNWNLQWIVAGIQNDCRNDPFYKFWHLSWEIRSNQSDCNSYLLST